MPVSGRVNVTSWNRTYLLGSIAESTNMMMTRSMLAGGKGRGSEVDVMSQWKA